MIISVSAWQVYRTGRVQGDEWLSGVGAGLLCSQVALAAHGLVDAVTWGMVRPAPLVWALWGITAAALLNLQARGVPKPVLEQP